MTQRRLKFVEPMKAMVAPAPPYDGRWLYEVKFDGFRVLAIKNGREVELWSRNKKRLDERFPDVARAVAKLPVKACILDGEVCALNEQGKSSFQLLQNSAETSHPVVYYVFDLLFEGGRDLRRLPLTERRALSQSRAARNTAPARSDSEPTPHFLFSPLLPSRLAL